MRARSTGRYLFLRDAETGLWETPGGKIERGETAREAAVREFREETGFRSGSYTICSLEVRRSFALYRAERWRQFAPALSREHTAFSWADPDNVPEPLHPGLRRMLTR